MPLARFENLDAALKERITVKDGICVDERGVCGKPRWVP